MTETTANQPQTPRESIHADDALANRASYDYAMSRPLDPIKASDQYEVILHAKLNDEGDILESHVFAIVKKADAPSVAARLMFERPRTGWVYLRRSPMFTGQIVR